MKWLNRDISWLYFNERVLQEAESKKVPLIERLRYLGIYSNNLDEFYRVRVASIRRLSKEKNFKFDSSTEKPKELLAEIQKIVIEQHKRFNKSYEKIINELKKEQIFIQHDFEPIEEHLTLLKDYFEKELLHNVVPILLSNKKLSGSFRDTALYLGVKLNYKKDKKPKYAILQVPEMIKRFFSFELEGKTFVYLVDDILRIFLSEIFSILKPVSIEAYTFKFTRDASLEMYEDFSMNHYEKMMKSIKNRKKGSPVRLVYEQGMPNELLQQIIRHLEIDSEANTIPGGKYHNFKDFMRFPMIGKEQLYFGAFNAPKHVLYQKSLGLLPQLLKKAHLLHFPFDHFDVVVDTLRESALSPKVKAIWINVYRVAQNSQIMNSLINALRNGKQVTVVFELFARFDEEHNLYWSERLKEEGAKVLFGFNAQKVHSKLLLLQLKEKDKLSYLSYIGTGNFNESTSRFYTDLGYFTPDITVAEEIKRLFEHIENPLIPVDFQRLLVSPFNNRSGIKQAIKKEIQNAKKGLKSGIKIKVNNFTDLSLMVNLIEAARNGVKVQLIIRSTCIYKPSLEELPNMEIRSVVGRFLEHSRFLLFENNGKPSVYITSADFMERNLDHRIEVSCKIEEKGIIEKLNAIFSKYWEDQIDARSLNSENFNQRIGKVLNSSAQNNLMNQLN